MVKFTENTKLFEFLGKPFMWKLWLNKWLWPGKYCHTVYETSSLQLSIAILFCCLHCLTIFYVRLGYNYVCLYLYETIMREEGANRMGWWNETLLITLRVQSDMATITEQTLTQTPECDVTKPAAVEIGFLGPPIPTINQIPEWFLASLGHLIVLQASNIASENVCPIRS